MRTRRWSPLTIWVRFHEALYTPVSGCLAMKMPAEMYGPPSSGECTICGNARLTSIASVITTSCTGADFTVSSGFVCASRAASVGSRSSIDTPSEVAIASRRAITFDTTGIAVPFTLSKRIAWLGPSCIRRVTMESSRFGSTARVTRRSCPCASSADSRSLKVVSAMVYSLQARHA